MQAQPRFARLRSLSANDAGLEGSYVSSLGYLFQELEREFEWILDLDTTTKNERAHMRPVVVAPGRWEGCDRSRSGEMQAMAATVELREISTGLTQSGS